MTPEQIISEHMRKPGKMSREKSPLPREHYVAMGKKSKRGKAKKTVDNSLDK